jgi:hypothetical protein
MIQTLAYFPGQKVTIYLETVNNIGVRTDSASLPSVQRVIFPDFSLASGYPQNMIKLDTGLYYHQFTLPKGAVSVGSYLVDVSYISPATSQEIKQIYQITVTAPYGNFNATIG